MSTAQPEQHKSADHTGPNSLSREQEDFEGRSHYRALRESRVVLRHGHIEAGPSPASPCLVSSGSRCRSRTGAQLLVWTLFFWGRERAIADRGGVVGVPSNWLPLEFGAFSHNTP